MSVPDVAKMYGLRPNHHGMVRCPFHDDRHPSLKLNEVYFYCFGCGATGDVIDLTARLFALKPYEAAKKLAADFGIDPDKPPSTAALVKPKHPMIRAFREDERYCQRVLCDYLHLLEDWKVRYEPQIKLMAYSEDIPLQYDRIHVANGTWYLDGRFTGEKEYCRNRLTVDYNPDAGIPGVWLRFLSELLIPDDILTLQEYMGYCLIPTTKAQKMLMLIGKGGEGKPRIGLVMISLLGINMNTTSIQKVEKNDFARADLEDRLLMVEDDMDMSALTKTNYIKSIVTSECQMDVERKHEQSYQTLLYVRFLCFGNGALTALHDRSDGFFRRQIVHSFSF